MEATVYLEDNEYIALCDLLKLAGLAESGGQAKAFIAEGLVLRNGGTEIRKTAKIRGGEVIEFDGARLKSPMDTTLKHKAEALLGEPLWTNPSAPSRGNAAAATAARRAFRRFTGRTRHATMRNGKTEGSGLAGRCRLKTVGLDKTTFSDGLL